MVNINDCFPSKYIKAADLADQAADLIMSDVVLEEVGDGDVKPILYFELLQTGLLLNRTNANTIAEAYGLETDEWRGQPLQLYPAETTFRGSVVPCVRVRVPNEDRGRGRGRSGRGTTGSSSSRRKRAATSATASSNGQSIHDQLKRRPAKGGLR